VSAPFNAWHNPVCVVWDGQKEVTVSLRELFADAHRFHGLAGSLTPLDRDSLLRLLYAIGAVILRMVPDSDWPEEAAFPQSGVDAFGAAFSPLFDITGEENGDRPFLQRWDRSPADLGLLGAPNRSIESIIKPLIQLHPHEPGSSSLDWAVRRDTRNTTTWPVVAQLLVTAWFQTKNGNGQDPWGGKHLKGSSGTWHTNPLAIHLVDPTNLARTLWANIPTSWVERDDLPLFLSPTRPHEPRSLPQDFAISPIDSVCRFTYAKTLPLLFVKEGVPLGFVIGEDSTIPVPLLAMDSKESLGLVHEGDPTRLYTEVTVKGRTERKPRGSWGARLSTSEGFEKWFRQENGVSAAIRGWRSGARLLSPRDDEMHNWQFGLYSETTDGKGNRQWADWSAVPAVFMSAGGEALEQIQRLLALAAECKSAMAFGLRRATGDSKTPAGLATTQSAFWSRTQPAVETLMAEQEQGGLTDEAMRSLASEIRRAALVSFELATAPLGTPSQIRHVARAQRWYAGRTLTLLNKSFPSSEEAT
jgi:hypothetical protein